MQKWRRQKVNSKCLSKYTKIRSGTEVLCSVVILRYQIPKMEISSPEYQPIPGALDDGPQFVAPHGVATLRQGQLWEFPGSIRSLSVKESRRVKKDGGRASLPMDWEGGLC